ncbi:Synapse-associated protein 1 [Trichinella sp. T8]|nr:Synapse-associated protein 1 [Trichinella sp. T8]
MKNCSASHFPALYHLTVNEKDQTIFLLPNSKNFCVIKYSTIRCTLPTRSVHHQFSKAEIGSSRSGGADISCLSMLNRWLSAKWNKAEVSEASGIESSEFVENETNSTKETKKFDVWNVLNEAKKFLVSSGSEVENILKRKAESFVMRSQENTNSVAVSFWDGLENEFLVKKQIMSLSLDEEAFLRAPPIGTEFSFDFDSYVSQAEAALKADPNLENIRFRLVPRKIKEEDFWRNYFYRVHLVRSNAAAAAELATPVEAAEDGKTEEKKNEETEDIEQELEDEDLSVDEKGRPVLDSCDFDLLGDAWEEEIQRICQFSNMTMRLNRFSHVVMKVVVIVVVVVVVAVAVASIRWLKNSRYFQMRELTDPVESTGKVEQPSSPSNKQAAVLLVVICDVFTQLKSIRIVLTLAMTTVKTTNSYYYEETSQSSPVRPPRRSKNVTHKQMNQILDEVKSEQEKNVVIDTLAALVTDVNATAQVLRRSVSRTRLEEYDRETPLLDVSRSDSTFERPPSTVWDRRGPEVEYHLLIHSPAHMDYTDSRYSPAGSRKHAWDQDSQKSGAPFTSMESLSRARSETPSRKIIVLEEPVKSASPVCAACKQPISGPCITALAPNSTKAQKYHPSHFVCSYCMKPLNLKGTYREHERKPYCHECFYRLYTNTVQIKSLQLVNNRAEFPHVDYSENLLFIIPPYI